VKSLIPSCLQHFFFNFDLGLQPQHSSLLGACLDPHIAKNSCGYDEHFKNVFLAIANDK
jgi:hypothetical protein